MTFSQKIKELRTEKGISQDELANATGLSHGCIAMLEVGKRAPTATTLTALADFFEVSTDYLLGRADDFGVISISTQKNPTSDLTSEEKHLLETFRKLDMKNRMHVTAYADVRLEEQGTSTRRA